MDMMELNRLCAQPGREGMVWRLIRAWDPDKMAAWIREERAKGASPDDIIHAVATAMSGAAFNVGQHLGGDRKGALLGERGLVAQLRAMIAHSLETIGGRHNIIVPGNPGFGIKKVQ